MIHSLKHLRHLGHIWGDWTRRGCRGLGYPSETAVSRLRTSPGRSTVRNIAPDYEPCPIARRFDDASKQISFEQQNLIYCRFVCGMSDSRLMEYDSRFHSEGAARWAVEKALKDLGKHL